MWLVYAVVRVSGRVLSDLDVLVPTIVSSASQGEGMGRWFRTFTLAFIVSQSYLNYVRSCNFAIALCQEISL